MTILDEIFAHKLVEVAERKRIRSLSDVRRAAEAAPPPLDFVAALLARSRRAQDPRPALIAEVKHASPSRGILVKDFDPLALAHSYRVNGAAAISVLTDERYFKGSLAYLEQIAEASAGQAAVPLLRKDFICDVYQVYEARAARADAVLLIAAHVEPGALRDLQSLAQTLGMAALVEVHSRSEIEVILPTQPTLVGINNRNLHTFEVSLRTTLDLLPCLPAEIARVAESGLHTAADVAQLAAAGVDAILVGEALVTAADVPARVRELSGITSERK